MIPILISLSQTIGVEVQRSLEKHQILVLFHLGMVVCNLFLSVWFCRLWGEVGSALGTGTVLFFVDGIVMGIYYQKALGIQVFQFWKQLAGMGRGLLLPICFGVLCVSVIGSVGLAAFLGEIAIYVIIYVVSMYLFSMNALEKELLREAIDRIFGILKIDRLHYKK